MCVLFETDFDILFIRLIFIWNLHIEYNSTLNQIKISSGEGGRFNFIIQDIMN